MNCVIAACLIILTCTFTASAEDGSGNFRGRWWNYYNRGMERAATGNWADAESDLRRALSMRQKDQRMARTYGMHFTDYFVHRELGIILYRTGRFDKALLELTESMAQEKSAKGAYYLNLVRRELMLNRGASFTLPTIRIDGLHNGMLVADPALKLSGIASGEALIAAININGIPWRFDLAQTDIPFSTDIELEDGDNSISLEAVDLTGQRVGQSFRVTLDRQGPLVAITAAKALDNGSIRVSGEISDEAGLSFVSINGISRSSFTQPEYPFELTVPRGSVLKITAKDTLGNETAVTTDAQLEAVAMERRGERLLLASNDSGFFARDRERPVIDVKDAESIPPVFVESYYLEATVSDNAKVEKILVNGKDVPVRKGKKLFFSKLVKLKEGENNIAVEAFDSSGNHASTVIKVIRLIPSILRNSSRMHISIIPFDGKADVAVMAIADDLLDESVVNQKRFRLIEREKLSRVLAEQKLVKADLTDPQHSIKVGRLLSADAIVATTARGQSNSLELVSRVINAETSEVMAAVDVYTEDTGRESLRELLQGLAAKIARAFPLVNGTVIRRDKEEILVDIGLNSSVVAGMGVIVHRRGKDVIHPVTGKSLGADSIIIGEGTIEGVTERFSRIRLNKRSKNTPSVNKLDLVVTK